jgi:membrane protease YdiL (CAAX protease family)
MHTVRSLIVRHPLAAYVVIAFAITWTLTAMVGLSLVFGLLALFGPAVAATIVTRADGTYDLLRSRIVGWRRAPIWYAIAIGVPFGVAAAARVIQLLTGGGELALGAVSAIEITIFGLVIGEEIGWRGFLQPRLRTTRSIAGAGLVTGIVWTLWHAPMYVGGELLTFVAFAWWVIPLSVVMGFVSERARWSVVVATVMHGSANIATPILLPGVERTWTLAVAGTIYLVLATGLAWREVRGRARRDLDAPGLLPDLRAVTTDPVVSR